MIWTVLGTIGVVAVTVIAGWFADRKWGLLPRKERLARPPRPALPAHREGEAPATAVRVSAGHLESLRTAQRCCRSVMESLADDEVAYGGGMLGILRFRCATCGGARSIYVQRLVE